MLSGILFDLDGTLVNTDPLHYKAWKEILREYKLEIDENFYKKRISGQLNKLIVKDLLPYLSSEEGQQVIEEKEVRFRKLLPNVQPLPGLSDVLAWANKSGLKRAVVSNSPPINLDFLLSALSLTDAFDTVILAEEVGIGKPDPAPYQLALKRLNLAPQDVVAFEDSSAGIRSSIGAGIQTIGITSTHASDDLCNAGAMMAIPNFKDEQLWSLLLSSSRVRVNSGV